MGKQRVIAVAVLVLLAVLIVNRPIRPLFDQPAPDAQSYAQLANDIAHGDGYSVDIPGERRGSRYPPGAPVMYARFAAAGVPLERAAQTYAVALLVAVWALAWRLRGPVAATVAVMILGSSPVFQEQSSYVMADIPAALVTVLAAWCVISERHMLAGVLAGWAAWTRLAAVVTVAGMRRRAWLPFLVLLAGLAVVKLVVGFGYEGGGAEWSLGHVFSGDGIDSFDNRGGNLWAYSLMLLGIGGGLTWPGVIPLAAWGAWRHPGGRWALTVGAGTLAVYLAYFWQAPRFFLPVLALAAVYAGAQVAALAADAGAPELRTHLRGGARADRL